MQSDKGKVYLYIHFVNVFLMAVFQEEHDVYIFQKYILVRFFVCISRKRTTGKHVVVNDMLVLCVIECCYARWMVASSSSVELHKGKLRDALSMYSLKLKNTFYTFFGEYKFCKDITMQDCRWRINNNFLDLLLIFCMSRSHILLVLSDLWQSKRYFK